MIKNKNIQNIVNTITGLNSKKEEDKKRRREEEEDTLIKNKNIQNIQNIVNTITGLNSKKEEEDKNNEHTTKYNPVSKILHTEHLTAIIKIINDVGKIKKRRRRVNKD